MERAQGGSSSNNSSPAAAGQAPEHDNARDAADAAAAVEDRREEEDWPPERRGSNSQNARASNGASARERDEEDANDAPQDEQEQEQAGTPREHQTPQMMRNQDANSAPRGNGAAANTTPTDATPPQHTLDTRAAPAQTSSAPSSTYRDNAPSGAAMGGGSGGYYSNAGGYQHQPAPLTGHLSDAARGDAPQPLVSPSTRQMHFPYASSNFVTPNPTPIRPLHGDPRVNQQAGPPGPGPNNATGANGTNQGPSGYDENDNKHGYAVPTSRMFHHQTSSPSFYTSSSQDGPPMIPQHGKRRVS
ncbi:TPA: hypothetical protein N0F65_001268 [Lagenidium giganteum]|uniref:Uncharacterized protein n=1 Tax=Lagenidium giganteum TaxID=4803 RepID=A0AAV2YV29_9STRA|nr:TPA: hypothetical protein N0F65_001268 [Lagenidium giganteum]